ncbi:MAG: protein-glutamate O-methyltransferase CheR [Cellulosilyticaceae bacterium]
MNYTEFKKHILSLTTIDLNAYKENQMKRRIDAIIKKNHCAGYADYLQLLKSNRTILEEFVAYLTINVSEFFRNPSQWDTLEKEIIPLLLKKKSSLKIWSAACSTGDEPYSLAMVLSKFMPLSKIKIIATDLDKDVLAKAKAGEYIDKHIANIPREFENKYFIKKDNMYVIAPEIKRCISFEQHNLLKDPYPTNVDLIVCRNVLIYFTEEAKSEIYQKFSNSLVDDGILFVGSTEQIIGSQKYGLDTYRVFFYQKIKK